MSSDEELRERARTLEYLLEVQERVALEQTERLESLLEQREREADELEMAQVALRASDARQHAIVHSSLDAIITMDLEGRIEEFSAAAEAIFGYSCAEVLGRQLSELIIPPRFRAAHHAGLQHFKESGEGPVLRQRIEISAIRRDGSEFPVELTIVPIEVAGRTIFTGFVRDITIAKRNETRLGQLQALTDVALGSLRLDELLPELVDRIKDLLAPDLVAILLLSEEREDELELAAGIGIPEGELYRVKLGTGVAGKIARGRTPVIVENVQEVPGISPKLRASGVRAVLGVALFASEQLVGVLQIGVADDRSFTEEDADLIARVGERISTAIQNARAYEHERQIAHTLQMSLLPSQLEQVPGLDLSVRYVPAIAGSTVGGDWYDVIPLASGRVGIAIGDVMGRGAVAAAVMGRLRYATRAYAVEGDPPEVVLARLNNLVLQTHDVELATMIYAVLDPETGELAYCSAGHPMPLRILDPSRSYLPGQPSPPIGVDAALPFSRSETILEPGEVLVLYTDGLIEHRGEDLLVGMERLRNAIPQSFESAHDAADAIAQVLLPQGGPGDDAAYLIVRRCPIESPTPAPDLAARR